jgi:hypothetical protein
MKNKILKCARLYPKPTYKGVDGRGLRDQDVDSDILQGKATSQFNAFQTYLLE